MDNKNENSKKGNDSELIFSFQKNNTEEIRATMRKYKGKHYFDIRLYYLGDEEEWLPTKKGVSLSTEFFPEFKQAIESIEKAIDNIEE